MNFFPSNAFLRRRRKKALLRVNDRGGGWRTCILALCRVCVRVCARLSYIIGHNYHGHYLHAGGLSVNNYVRENKVREVNVRE